MLSVTREKGSGQIVLTSHGPLDQASVDALLQALALTSENSPVLIDLSRAELSASEQLRRLAIELAKRSGPVKFIGPAWARVVRSAR